MAVCNARSSENTATDFNRSLSPFSKDKMRPQYGLTDLWHNAGGKNTGGPHVENHLIARTAHALLGDETFSGYAGKARL